MVKDGFTDYEKKIYNYENGCIEEYQLQRLTCANTQCPGSKETHVLLRDDMLPHEPINSKTAEDVLKAHELFHKELALPTRPQKKLTQKYIKEICSGESFLNHFFKKYHGDFYLFKRYILSPQSKRLYSAVVLLRNIIPNQLRAQQISVQNITGQNYLSTDFKAISSENLSLSSILRTICRRGVISSTLHKLSLPYSVRNIVLRKEVIPP